MRAAYFFMPDEQPAMAQMERNRRFIAGHRHG